MLWPPLLKDNILFILENQWVYERNQYEWKWYSDWSCKLYLVNKCYFKLNSEKLFLNENLYVNLKINTMINACKNSYHIYYLEG